MPWNPADSKMFLFSRAGMEFVIVRGMARRRLREQEELAKLPHPCTACGADVWSNRRTLCPPCSRERGW